MKTESQFSMGLQRSFLSALLFQLTFDGIPVLNNLNATFYRFVGDPDRGEHDIDNI